MFEVTPCVGLIRNTLQKFHIKLIKRSQVFHGFSLTEIPMFECVSFQQVLQRNVDITHSIGMYFHLVNLILSKRELICYVLLTLSNILILIDFVNFF